jgi:hypothetical protein
MFGFGSTILSVCDVGTRMGNLKKHLDRYHRNEYEVVLKKESEAGSSSQRKGNKLLKLKLKPLNT